MIRFYSFHCTMMSFINSVMMTRCWWYEQPCYHTWFLYADDFEQSFDLYHCCRHAQSSLIWQLCNDKIIIWYIYLIYHIMIFIRWVSGNTGNSPVVSRRLRYKITYGEWAEEQVKKIKKNSDHTIINIIFSFARIFLFPPSLKVPQNILCEKTYLQYPQTDSLECFNVYNQDQWWSSG